jgi:hypothetical protein
MFSVLEMIVTLRTEGKMAPEASEARRFFSATNVKKPGVIAATPTPSPPSAENSTLGGKGAQPT